MRIYFVRHGQTDHNKAGIIQGHIDTPLNDHGREQAALLGQRLKDVHFDEAWSSSLSRASETAEIILKSHPDVILQQHSGLMERCLGSLQGRRWRANEKLPEDVESSDVFRKRITDWFISFLSSQSDRIKSTSANDDNREYTVLVTSHGAYLHAFLSILLSPPFCFARTENVDVRLSCFNTSVMEVVVRQRSEIERNASPEPLWQDVMRRADQTTKGKQEKEMEWMGVIQSWADIRHLDTESKEVRKEDEVGVADDVE